MLDPLVSVAVAIHSTPGAYAFLIGSGVSRSAKIPTGWEIVLDLVRKLATLNGEECDPDPEKWFFNKFSRRPDYSMLLDELSQTPMERQSLLRGYFEPNPEEREQDLKKPTKAHHAIADLVSTGHVRVLLTTNFDRLLELALQERGINPIVLATPDSVEGALPLIHQSCCIVKLHGDYLDTRIKNVSHELATFDARTRRLVKNILDDFGLIVVGWSGQWDTALRSLMEKCASRRFAWYWAKKSELCDEALTIITQRSAQIIEIEDADSFFARLRDLVQELFKSRRGHPTTTQAIVSLTKRYLSEARHRIDLDDLVWNESEEVRRQLDKYDDELLKTINKKDAEEAARGFRDIVDRFLQLVIHGCGHGNKSHDELWIRSIERLAQPKTKTGAHLIDGIRLFPITILIYGAGLSALSRGNISLLSALLTVPKMRDNRGARPLILALDWWKSSEWLKHTPKYEKHYVALSEYLFEILRDPLRRFLPDDEAFEECFDRFEYLRSLVYADLYKKQVPGSSGTGPTGRFCWKAQGENSISSIIQKEADAAGENWPHLADGLFGGSFDRFNEVKQAFDAHVANLGWAW